MGTNFYWSDTPEEWDDMDPEWHIGKRSAAGRWCWDCDETLKVGGREKVHYGGDWLDACPRCGTTYVPGTAPFSAGPAAVELGFAAPERTRPTGVSACSSFTWAQHPEHVATRCQERENEQVVVDEYGRPLTGREFLDMLGANCPLQFTDMVGKAFC